jgi:site-specific DNA-methyltransferase (adenine-specific)
VARKPLVGTVAENVLTHGTGAINVDGCRVGTDGGTAKANIRKGETNGERAGMSLGENISFRCDIATINAGRWPANLIHDGSEEVVGLFPQTGASPRGLITQGGKAGGGFNVGSSDGTRSGKFQGHGDSGSAARFFYCAKASKADRGGDNKHPTVKPTDLMRYLCRLVTPPSGVVLDPFTGSGSTGKAAILEGFRFIGIEREAEYVEIAKARIAAVDAGAGPLFA